MRVGCVVAFLGLLGCASGSREGARGRSSPLPVVDIFYPPVGTIFDRSCPSFLAKKDVTPEMIEGAAAVKPRLENEWMRHGTRYVAEALEEIGAPYPYREVQAVLTVCSVPTMSTPLLLNIRRYLPGAEHPSPDEEFSETLFHELMHHYTHELSADSAMKKKYAAESLLVLNHLHVIALEKMVLSKLGETKELAAVEDKYRNAPRPDYKRAWEIVSDIEGPEPFLRELKEAARKK